MKLTRHKVAAVIVGALSILAALAVAPPSAVPDQVAEVAGATQVEADHTVCASWGCGKVTAPTGGYLYRAQYRDILTDGHCVYVVAYNSGWGYEGTSSWNCYSSWKYFTIQGGPNWKFIMYRTGTSNYATIWP